jgi:hypothetical protein
MNTQNNDTKSATPTTHEEIKPRKKDIVGTWALIGGGTFVGLNLITHGAVPGGFIGGAIGGGIGAIVGICIQKFLTSKT